MNNETEIINFEELDKTFVSIDDVDEALEIELNKNATTDEEIDYLCEKTFENLKNEYSLRKGPAQLGIKALEPMGQNLKDAIFAMKSRAKDTKCIDAIKFALSQAEIHAKDSYDIGEVLLVLLQFAEEYLHNSANKEHELKALEAITRDPASYAWLLKRIRKLSVKAHAEAKDYELSSKTLVRENFKYFTQDNHDGLLISRDNAFRFGVARFARAFTSSMNERVAELFNIASSNMGGNLSEIKARANIWSSHKTLLFIDRINTLTTKLVLDMWLTDPDIAVVLRSETLIVNPFAEMRIPFIVDTSGAISVVLNVGIYPSVVQRIFGGISVMSSVGPLQPIKRKNKLEQTIPEWFRMFALIGLISTFSEFSEKTGLKARFFLRPRSPSTALMLLRQLVSLKTHLGVKLSNPNLRHLMMSLHSKTESEVNQFIKILEEKQSGAL